MKLTAAAAWAPALEHNTMLRGAIQTGVKMAAALPTRFRSTDSDVHQLATLIANMIEDHLRAASESQQLPTGQQQET